MDIKLLEKKKKQRTSIEMGFSNLNAEQLEKLIDELTLKYRGNTYHPIKLNCNSFSEEFCRKLVNKSIPSYINRFFFLWHWVFI